MKLTDIVLAILDETRKGAQQIRANLDEVPSWIGQQNERLAELGRLEDELIACLRDHNPPEAERVTRAPVGPLPAPAYGIAWHLDQLRLLDPVKLNAISLRGEHEPVRSLPAAGSST